MNALSNKKSFSRAAAEGFEKKSQDPAWLIQVRQKAFERFQFLGFPSRKQEAWKYIYLEGLLQNEWLLPSRELSAKKFSSPAFSALLNEENFLVFANGLYQPDRSKTANPFSSLLSTRLDDAGAWAEDLLLAGIQTEENPFRAVNMFQFQEGLFLRIPKHTVLDKPLHVLFLTEGESALNVPKILVSAGEGSRVHLVFHFQNAGEGRSFTNAAADFVLGAGARVSCAVTQQAHPDAAHFLSVKADCAAGSVFDWANYAAGGLMIRNEVRAELNGEGASASASGLSILSNNSQAFQHLIFHHKAAHCTSRQVYKNILAGKSAAEFNSLVHVHRGARQSDSEQLDKNILLSETARVYSRPQLKIDHDDVKASHGAATGQLEKNEVFYLRSRGLSEEQARLILIYGFAKQVLEKMNPASLRASLESDMETRVRTILAEESSWT